MPTKTTKKTKSKGVAKLKSMTPKKKRFIIVLPDEIEDGLHWLFWLLLLLILVFLISIVVIKFTDFPTTLSLLF